MQANDRALGNVFDLNIRLKIPLFQRPYVWKQEENWKPLWDAVKSVANRRISGEDPRPHFLGALVLERIDVATGEIEARHVIDGQQRLTTLQVMLAAIRDVCAEKGATHYCGAFSRLIENYDASRRNPDSKYKVWPTSQDRTHFVHAMTSGSPEALLDCYAAKKARRVGHQIPQAYLYFFGEVKEWIGAASGEMLNRYFESLEAAIRQDLLLVVVDLGGKDDAQLIFETMNALMTPLLPGDLIKNLLFHRAERQKLDVQAIYNQYWMTFDDDEGFWRKEVRQGRLKRPLIDLYIQHYLTLKKRDVIEISHLYGDYKKYLDESQCLNIEAEVKSLREYADVYKSFREWPSDSQEQWFFRRLDQLDTQMPVPILLEVFKNPKSDEDRWQILQLIESYLVRRAVRGLTYKAYNRIFVDLVKRLSGTEFSAAEVRTYLLSREGDSSRWPTDQEFTDAIVDAPLYKLLKGTRLRLLLEAFERSLYDKRTENVDLPGRLTIEHIMPQAWQEHWPLGDGAPEEQAQNRNHVVQTIGNLTLLTRELNATESNGPWMVKKSALLRYSKLLMNSRVQCEEEWDEKAIMKRSKLIAEKAKLIWPRPSK